MTVANNTPYKIQAGPQTAPWSTALPFQWREQDEIIVLLVDTNGVESTLTLGVHYSLSGGNGDTGTLSGLVDIGATDSWYIYRSTDQSQVFNYQELDAFPAEDHEEALDRLNMLVQELSDAVSRSVQIRRSDDRAVSLELPILANRTEKYLYVDASGNILGVDAVLASSFPASPYMTGTFFALVDAAAVRSELSVVRNKGLFDNAQRGTAGAKPAAATFGNGIYVETDTDIIQSCDSVNYSQMVLSKNTYNSLPNTSNRIGVATDRNQIYKGTGAAKSLIRSFAPGYIAGCTLSRASGTQITFGTGSCRNLFGTAGGVADEINITLAAALTKDSSGTWVAGAAQPGLASAPVLNNQWYHCFLLVNEAGTVDAGLDTNANGSGLLTLSTASGYHWARRVGSVKTNAAGAFLPFIQWDDHFIWTDLDAMTVDFEDGGDVDYKTTAQTRTMVNAPAGIRTRAKVRIYAKTAPSSLTDYEFMPSDVTDFVPADGSAGSKFSASSMSLQDGTVFIEHTTYDHWLLLNTSQAFKVRYSARGDATHRLGFMTREWQDVRGKNLV